MFTRQSVRELKNEKRSYQIVNLPERRYIGSGIKVSKRISFNVWVVMYLPKLKTAESSVSKAKQKRSVTSSDGLARLR